MSAKKGENAASPAGPKSTPTTSDRSADKSVVDTAQPPPDADGQKEQQPSTGKGERVEAPSKVKQEVAQQPGPSKPHHAPSAKINWEKWGVLVPYATPIVAFASAILALVGVIVAARTATVAAKAAQDSIELTREMSQLAQRAWVAPIQIGGQPEVGQPFRVFVTIRNSGNTFAKEVRVATSFVSRDDGTLPNYAKVDKMEGIEGTPGVGLLAPNTVYQLSAFLNADKEKKLNKAEVDAIDSGKVAVFAYGKIAYWDIFGVEHWTKFSVQYQEGKYKATEQFNDADNNRAPPAKDLTTPAKGD
jgi:hypothetical protein